MNKITFSILTILIAGVVIVAQSNQADSFDWEKKNDGNCGCKYDRDGGHIDLVEEGKIIQIVDQNTVIFENADAGKRTIDLLSVDSDANEKEAKAFLIKNALAKNAELVYSMSQMNAKKISGIITIEKTDINRLMLESGIASYKKSKIYQIASFYDCVYFRSEDEAKSKKLGIWAK